MKKSLAILILVFFIASCSSNISKDEIEKRLKSMQELGTVEYTLSKILAVDDEQWYSVGDRKVLISLKANLKAGVNFSKIEIISLDNSSHSIDIKLPKSKIILLDIQPDDIKYELIKISGLRGEFSNEEMNKIQILGEEAIKSKVKELGILEEAEKNSKLFITNWLNLVGIETVNFKENS